MTELIQHLSLGFSVALTLQNLMYCFIGCFLGTLIGVLPGINGVPALLSSKEESEILRTAKIRPRVTRNAEKPTANGHHECGLKKP